MSTNDAPLPGHTDAQIFAMARQANRAVFWRWLSIFAIIGLGVVGIISAHASSEAQQASEDVQDTQIAGCRAAIAPGGARYIQADGIQKQENRNTALNFDKKKVAESFGITVAQLKDAQAREKADAKDQIQDLLNVDCSTGRAIPQDDPHWAPPVSLGT